MSSHMSVLVQAVGIGILLTAALASGAFFAYEADAERVADILLWPNTLLQSALPCFNIGTPERPLCEGTPLNFVAFLASFPVGITAYSTLAYFWLRRRRAER